jgi:uroporphyrinogen decarboxylase
MDALNFHETDRVPKDLGGMLSTSISAFAYPKLVEALGLPYRRPKVYDTNQMLAMPDMDVLDALGCDIVALFKRRHYHSAEMEAKNADNINCLR